MKFNHSFFLNNSSFPILTNSEICFLKSMQTFFEITFLTEFVMILEVTTLKIHKTLTNIYILSKKTFHFKDFFSDNLILKKNSEILKINEFMIDYKPTKMAH